jgi:xylulose-5-phosphate/fructose-6-phosphate phosphoketolase
MLCCWRWRSRVRTYCYVSESVTQQAAVQNLLYCSAWHACKYIDPKESGAVIPILHVNGFKISERTISGCMDNREMACLYSGYGYEPRIVEDLDDIDADMHASLEWAVEQIKTIQHAARTGHPITKPRWPMLILRTPKGWGCPKEVHGELVEGTFRSHQVPLPKAKSDHSELTSLQTWLETYRPWELFLDSGAPTKSIDAIVPVELKRLGIALQNWNHSVPLTLPNWKDFSVEKGTKASCLKTAASFVDEGLCRNKQTLRIFSPDELVSNKLDTVFNHTSRNFQWDKYSMNKGGQVIEMLSEHTLQGWHSTWSVLLRLTHP